MNLSWNTAAAAARTRRDLAAAGGRVRQSARWQRGATGELLAEPVRCVRDQWYVARATPAGGGRPARAEVLVRFVHRDTRFSQRVLTLHALAGQADPTLFGWIETPEDATYLQLCLPDAETAAAFEAIVFEPSAERDPKCHPLANVPRWSTYRPPFAIERVLLPPELEGLREALDAGQRVEVRRFRRFAALREEARGAACVLDRELGRGVSLRELERWSAQAWVIVDLETMQGLLAGRNREKQSAELRVLTHASQGIISARVEYADVQTRGFALQDVFPYGYRTAEGAFAARVLKADRAWKQYADKEGFATLLASETPEGKNCGDVLSAARPASGGELMATDLPWIVAGRFGRPVAPRIAGHALRMHLGGEIREDVQYWNRWDEADILVRDIAELSRRYPPLQAVRWADEGGLVKLGIALPAASGGAGERTLVLRTGRIDPLAMHDGLPPEPMIIFMKMLARGVREGEGWVERGLRKATVIWQFDSAAGTRYAANYGSAAAVVRGEARGVLVSRPRVGLPAAGVRAGLAGERLETIDVDEGMFGEGSVEYQVALNGRLRALIELAG